jgi:vacuolar-type H+-ATPase subunit D/Vma8
VSLKVEASQQRPFSLSDLIVQFQSALDEEINVLRTGQKRQIELYDGERTGSIGGRFIYRFQTGDLSSWRRRRRGTQITISVSDQTVQGIIDIWNRKEAQLAFETDIGERVEKAVIEDSAIELLINLKTKLEKVKTESSDFNVTGSMKLFGLVQPRVFSIPIPLTKSYDDFCPNIEQERAIRTSMSQEVTFIWGPPGTGKTKTLTSILKNLIQAQKRVLLVAHTNRAVDEILKKFIDDPNNLPLIDDGKIVRLGIPDDDEEVLNCILLDKVAEKRATRLKEEIDSFVFQIMAIQNKIRNYRSLVEIHQKKLEEKGRILQEHDYLIQQKCNFQSRITKINGDLEKLSETLYEKFQLSEKCKSANAFKKLFLNLNQQQLETDISSINNKKALLRLELESLKKQVEEKNQEIASMSNKLKQYPDEINVAVDGLTSIAQLQNKIESLQAEIERNNQTVIQLRTKLAKVHDSVFNDAAVIGSTIARASLDNKITNRKFDTLIIDEASMAPLPNVFFLATVCSSHYIISGDFRQLSPIAQSKGRFCEQWLRKDIFKQAGIEESVNAGILDDPRLVMLRDQFRMHPAISDLVSSTVYEHRLRTPETVAIQKQILADISPFKGQAVIFCDTASVDPLITVPEKSYSRLSPYSAAFCSRLAAQCIEEAQRNGTDIKVGIITPYREQAKLLSRMLEDKGIENESCIASTIHRFQGAEKDIVIFDLVEGSPLRPGKLVSGKFKESEAGKLITVAISRAKGKFILVGNSAYIQEAFPSTEAVHQLLDKIQLSGHCEDSRVIELSFSDCLNVDPRRLIDASFDLLDEADFYQAFKKDLNNAKSRIVVFSPFVSKERVEDLLPDFKSALERGVQIFLIVRNPQLSRNYRKDNNETLNELARNGVNVIPAYKGLGIDENIEKFHYKVALIDNIALYYGSLNILSQIDSSESMMVFRSKKAIAQLSRAFQVSEFVKGERLVPTVETIRKAEYVKQLAEVNTPPPIKKEPAFDNPISSTSQKLSEIIEKFDTVQPGKYVREYAEQKLCQIGADLGFTAVTNYPIENLFEDGRRRIISVVWLSDHNEIQTAFQVRRKAYDINVITSLKDRRKLSELKAKEKYLVNVSEREGTAHFFNVTTANVHYYPTVNNETLPRQAQTTSFSISTAKQMTHANQRWTPEEEKELKEAFAQGLTIGQLAKKHQRTRGAIQMRLAQLGLIDDFVPFFMRKKKKSS